MSKTRKFTKKTLSLLLTLMIMLSMAITAAPSLAADAVPIAEWVATSAMVTASSHEATTGTGTLSQSRNSSIAWSSSAYGAQDANAWIWNPDGAYWQLSGISTLGYSNLSLKLNARSSGTGPRDFKVFYSVDGTDYLPATANAVDYLTGNAGWINNNVVPIPAGAENCASLSIRLVNITNISARAGTSTYAENEAIAGGGTSQIQNVSLTGIAGDSGDPTDPQDPVDPQDPPEPPEPPEPTVIAISEARAMVPSSGNGPTVTVAGVVTYRYNTTGLHIQDGTGENDGIYVYIPGANLVAAEWVGKEIKATGYLQSYNGLPEVTASMATVEVLGEGTFDYLPVTLAQISAGKYKCMAVTVADVQLTARNAATTLQNHTITKNEISVTLRTALPAIFAADDWITVNKGYVYVYQNAAQIMCDDDPDVIHGNAPVVVETEGEGELAGWSLGAAAGTAIAATSGDFGPDSMLQFIKGEAPQTLNFSSGGANLSGLNGFANNAYWLATVSSKGFANIEVSWNMRSSATGPRDFKLQYSPNGVTWFDAVDPEIVVPSAIALNNTSYKKALPAGAMDCDTLYIRWLMTSDTAANGSAIGSSGTHQINYISVTGGYLLGENQLRSPAVAPAGGAIPLGQAISLTPGGADAEIPGYAVMVSTDGGASWNEAEDARFIASSLPLALQVKATAPGMADSRVSSYAYSQAKLPLVTASKGSGAVIPGATVRLENEVAAAIIMYKVNGSDPQPYTKALALEEDLFFGEPAAISVEAWAELEGYIPCEPTTFVYTIAQSGGERVYFGQLHSHTTLSDGAGSVEEAFRYARDVAGLDFFVVTDHSNSFDETGASSDNPASINLDTYNAASASWQRGQAAAANAFVPGQFISFYGYEMTWSGGPGHMNTFNTGGFVSRNNAALNSKAADACLRAYYDLLKRFPESISMFNHPGTTFGNFSNFTYYDPVIDQRITLLEVGNGEGAIESGGYFPSYEQYTLALDKGWHVAPANNQDNHLGKWGDSNTARTAIWTNDLSLDGVYQALRDMRVYATEVADLEIVYKVNGQPLGSILDEVPDTTNFTAEIVNPTAGNYVKSVCLVTNGGAEILRETPNAQDYGYSKTIDNPAPGYYYLRVVVSTPRGDRIAVTAPVWLGKGKAAGFSSADKTAIMPVVGEPLTLSTTLFNNESAPATLVSIEYKDQNGNVIGSFGGLNATIAPSSEIPHEITYTPQAAGSFTIAVTAVIRFADGNEMVFSSDIGYDVWDPDRLTYIGIDASHYNEYVDGNYKDNMANFASIAAELGVRVNILWTSDDLIAACANPKYRTLILTAPSRRVDPVAMNPTTGQLYGDHRSYSQAELEAVAAFSESGGTVVLTGWSNVYESYAYTRDLALADHMAAQQNQVLAALGSTLRLADDAAMDSLQWSSATDQYRLYMTDALGSYNWGSPLLEGAVEAQIFSQYGGSTVYAVDPADKANWDAAPSAALPDGVDPVIMMSAEGQSVNRETYPLVTNYRTDYTKHDGRYMLLASETILRDDGTESLVIAAGGAFMSNFEVKIEMDNASTLQYSNYNIALNLIKAIAPRPVVIEIAEAKQLPEGTQVTIEGIATSGVYSGGDAGNTGFFDCIYVQDATGGFNLFPVSSGVLEGQTIRATGAISSYQGELQIAVTKIEVIDSAINKIEPTAVTTEDAMSPANTGKLLSLTGVVSDIIVTDGLLSQFTITDESGVPALIYINAYITGGVDLSFIVDGATVSVAGLGSYGENNSGDMLPRIRVRDRNEIVLIAPPAVMVSATPKASVEVLKGNQNKLTITVTELYSDGSAATVSASFMIDNNAAAMYAVGAWKVYVNTKGNDQIRECYIVK